MIHAGTVISTKQPYRVVVTLFDTSKPAGGGAGGGNGGRLDAFLQRALPAAVSVRLSNKGSVIAEEMRECYPDTTVSVSFKVGHPSRHRLHGVIKLRGCTRWILIPLHSIISALRESQLKFLCPNVVIVILSFPTTTPSSAASIWRWRAITTAATTDRFSGIGGR